MGTVDTDIVLAFSILVIKNKIVPISRNVNGIFLYCQLVEWLKTSDFGSDMGK